MERAEGIRKSILGGSLGCNWILVQVLLTFNLPDMSTVLTLGRFCLIQRKSRESMGKIWSVLERKAAGGSDLGPDGLLEMVVSCHVGIQVNGSTNGLSLNQSHWNNEILKMKRMVFWVNGQFSFSGSSTFASGSSREQCGCN